MRVSARQDSVRGMGSPISTGAPFYVWAAFVICRGLICMSCMRRGREAQIHSMSSAHEEQSSWPRALMMVGRICALLHHARCCSRCAYHNPPLAKLNPERHAQPSAAEQMLTQRRCPPADTGNFLGSLCRREFPYPTKLLSGRPTKTSQWSGLQQSIGRYGLVYARILLPQLNSTTAAREQLRVISSDKRRRSLAILFNFRQHLDALHIAPLRYLHDPSPLDDRRNFWLRGPGSSPGVGMKSLDQVSTEYTVPASRTGGAGCLAQKRTHKFVVLAHLPPGHPAS